MFTIENNQSIILFLINIYSHNFLKNLYLYFNIYIIKKLNHIILIGIDTSEINTSGGPGAFLKGINQYLPYLSNNCLFIESSYFNNLILKPDYYYIPIFNFKENYFQKLIKNKIINKYIFGPNFVPFNWFSFPNKEIWMERRFSDFLNVTKGIAVHSNRIIEHLAIKSNTTNNIKKFKIIRACTNLYPKTVNSFNQRKIDIIFFEKYADLNHRKQGKELLSLLKQTKNKIVSICYGKYNKKMIKQLANDSKFIIYFSFYDTGAIGLKEIQNYGVITFTHQKDLVIDNNTCFYIPELENTDNMEPASNKILKIIKTINKRNIDSQLIAKKNQMINNCKNALKDLCEGLL